MARCASCRSITRGQNTRGRRCRHCGAPMILNAASDGFSDLRLVLAMERLSAEGRLAYTDHQLYYAVSQQRTARKSIIKRIMSSDGHPSYRTTTLTFAKFQAALAKWLGGGGWTPGRLLPVADMGGEPNRQRTGATGLAPELTAHGFDRAVVVEDVATAVMLVANNFHIDQRCAVFSEDGYPEAFQAELLAALQGNPALVVAVAHGASPRGAGQVHRMRRWFPQARLIEVGIRPDQVRRGNLYAQRDHTVNNPNPVVLSDTNLARLDQWEREWLAWGLTTPLSVLGPTKLMKLVGNAFTNAARLDEQGFADPSTRGANVGDATHLPLVDDGPVAPQAPRHPKAGARSGRSDTSGDYVDYGVGIWWWDVGGADGGDGFFGGDDFDGDG